MVTLVPPGPTISMSSCLIALPVTSLALLAMLRISMKLIPASTWKLPSFCASLTPRPTSLMTILPSSDSTTSVSTSKLNCSVTELSLSSHSTRSEEHTSELQSLMRITYAVFCFKKKNKKHNHHKTDYNTPSNVADHKNT